jgi:hypothetical protein
MKLATIGLAIAFALPTTVAFAEGTLNYSTFAARPIVRGRHTYTSRRNHASGQFRESLAPIMHDPSGININSMGYESRRTIR